MDEIAKLLNIKINDIKEFTDGTYSKVFLINNKYLYKENPTISSEVAFLKLNGNKWFQKVIIDSTKYAVYNFIEGNIMHNVKYPKEVVNTLIDITNNYHKTDISGYGHLYNIKSTFKEYLKSELLDTEIKGIDALKYLDNINENFDKTILHGDCGTHNFISIDDKLVGIIDPEGIIGDPKYDLLFGIVSNLDILDHIDLNDIIKDMYTYSLFMIILFDRIRRSSKYHPIDTNRYIDIFKDWEDRYENYIS